jgi:hypothetical protein
LKFADEADTINKYATILKQQGFFPGTDKVTFPYWAPDAGVAPAQAEQNLNSWTELFKTTFR